MIAAQKAFDDYDDFDETFSSIYNTFIAIDPAMVKSISIGQIQIKQIKDVITSFKSVKEQIMQKCESICMHFLANKYESRNAFSKTHFLVVYKMKIECLQNDIDCFNKYLQLLEKLNIQDPYIQDIEDPDSAIQQPFANVKSEKNRRDFEKAKELLLLTLEIILDKKEADDINNKLKTENTNILQEKDNNLIINLNHKKKN